MFLGDRAGQSELHDLLENGLQSVPATEPIPQQEPNIGADRGPVAEPHSVTEPAPQQPIPQQQPLAEPAALRVVQRGGVPLRWATVAGEHRVDEHGRVLGLV